MGGNHVEWALELTAGPSQASCEPELEGRSGQREQGKMVCKENKTEPERETREEKKGERRAGEWKEGKTDA